METPKDTNNLIQEAVDAVARGELIVFPTDTVYGIGCDPFNEEALDSLFEAKKRPSEKSIPVLVDTIETAQSLAEISEEVEMLLKKHWPGALTVVVKCKAPFPESLIKNETVALRMPDHEDLLELITAVGGALAATSANISGKPPLLTYDEVYAHFSQVAPVILPGVVKTGEPSTILDCTQGAPKVLRNGPIEIA